MDIAEIRKKAKRQAPHHGGAGQGSGDKEQGPGVRGQGPEDKRQAPETHDQVRGNQEQEPATPSPAPRALTPELIIPTELEYRRSLGYEDERGLTQFLTFELGPEEYALRVEEVREVIKMREVTDVPHTPPFVVGIISLRGEIIPLLDLRRRLNLASTGFTPFTRVVIASSPQGLMGLVVDQVTGIVKIEERHIEPPPPVKGDADIEFIRGIVRHDGRFLILLNLPKVTELSNLAT